MILKKIINFIYPTGFSCVNCGTDIFDDETYLCDDCKNILPYLNGNLCLHCSEPITGQGNYCLHCKGKKFECDKIVSPFKYEEIIKKFIIGLKYSNKKYYADCLTTYMATTFLKQLLTCDLVLCVPICDKRLKQRGYNQAEILAKLFADKINKEFDATILKRIKDTPTQTKLSFNERQKNMIDAFVVTNKNKIKDKHIVIIDDVFTTGATVFECSRILKKAGAKCVYAVTASHTILHKD